VQSPKCGSGNRPIDKAGALALVEEIVKEAAGEGVPARDMGGGLPDGVLANASLGLDLQRQRDNTVGLLFGRKGTMTMKQDISFPVLPDHFVVLDVETRYSAHEVGGWNRADRMGVSVAVLYDSRADAFTAYRQEDIPAMMDVVRAAPLVVGFNVIRFDYAVLAPHAPGCDFRKIPTLDMLLRVQDQLSYRVSLDNLATATLGVAKSADGMQALAWWKEGKLDRIEQYCRQDVALTRDLFLHGRDKGYVMFSNKAGQTVRVRATWAKPA
jgi:DEAD/DEAH box helicase domain-containing protein